MKREPLKNQKTFWGSKLYAVGVVCLVGLVIFALCLPQLVFQSQDRRICSETALEKREDIDIALLSASNYPSLNTRMTVFAEGLTDGKNYYVSSHEMDMAANEEIYQQFERDPSKITQSGFIWSMLSSRSLANSFIDKNIQIVNWEQFVIYSDDYAQGVNFIIWYFEFVGEDGEKMEVLLDAQDHTLYGVRAGHDTTKLEQWYDVTRDITLYEYFQSVSLAMDELWFFLIYNYEGMSDEEFQQFYNNVVQYYINESGDTTVQSQIILPSYPEWNFSDDNTLNMHVPYGAQHLNYIMKTLPYVSESGETNVTYPEVVFGFEGICRLIPPFSESF